MQMKSPPTRPRASRASTLPLRGRDKTKARPNGRAWVGGGARRRDGAARLLRAGLGEITLEWLVGFLGEVGVKLAELAAARHETLVRGLEEIRLNLDRLLQALRAEQLFGCRRGVLEGFLRVVRNLACDRLGDFAERAELLE